MTEDFDEVVLVFDTYESDFLKQKASEKRYGKDPIRYQIGDDTTLKHIPIGE